MRAYRAVRKLHEHVRRTALFLLAMATSVGCLSILLQAGDLTRVSQNGVWEAVDAVPQAEAGEMPWIRPGVFRLFRLNRDELVDTLPRAPREFTAETRQADVTMTRHNISGCNTRRSQDMVRPPNGLIELLPEYPGPLGT